MVTNSIIAKNGSSLGVFSMVMDPQHVPALDGSLDGSRWQQLYRQTLDHWMVEMQCKSTLYL